MLTLLVRPETELVASSQQILVRRLDLFPAVQTILLERLPLLTREDLMKIATIPHQRPAPHPCCPGMD